MCHKASPSGPSSVSAGGKRCCPRTIQGFKSNYVETESGEEYWISGPKKRGGDRLYGTGRVDIDKDAREDYWDAIRGEPGHRHFTFYRG